MKWRLMTVAATFAVIASFGSLSARAADVEIPPVETWQEMPVPYPPSPEMSVRVPAKWHTAPPTDTVVGRTYEGSTMYVRGLDGSLSLFVRSWNFWYMVGRGRDFKDVRVAMLTDNLEWVVGDTGEMIRHEITRDAGGAIVGMIWRFAGSHSAHQRTLEWKQ